MCIRDRGGTVRHRRQPAGAAALVAGTAGGHPSGDGRGAAIATQPEGRAGIGLHRYIGTIANAATVIASLHAGEKRLVFADSRRTVETLAARLRDRGTQTFVSHSSLSVDERRRAEQAFVAAVSY